MADRSETVSQTDLLFQNKEPKVLETYRRILAALREMGPFEEEIKRTSIHLVKGSGFAAIHPRKTFLHLSLRTGRRIEHGRISRVERLAGNRFQNEVKLSSPDEVDGQVIEWLRDAYEGK